MSEKRYDYIDEEEYGAYWIIDTKNCKKQLKDFPHKDYPDDLYDTFTYEEYILKHGTTLTSEQVIGLLNEQDAKIQELEKELTLMKDKAYYYGCCAIGETSTNYDKDIDNFRKEIYGDKAEQITQKEIEEDKKLYSRNTEHELPKKHNECIHYWEKLHECGDGHWWVERGCDLNPHLEVFGVCEDFKEKPPKKYYEV